MQYKITNHLHLLRSILECALKSTEKLPPLQISILETKQLLTIWLQVVRRCLMSHRTKIEENATFKYTQREESQKRTETTLKNKLFISYKPDFGNVNELIFTQ